jgi:hypothetical protein
VQLNIYNAAAAAHVNSGNPDAIIDDPDAWTFQFGLAPHELGDDIYNDHVVCVIERRRMLDVTLGQASRPEHGVQPGPGVFEPLPAGFLKGEGHVFDGPGGAVLVYEPHPEERGYLALPH